MQPGGTINDKEKTGRPSSWTSTKGIGQRRLGRKLNVSQKTITKQLPKMKISCYKREKARNRQRKQRSCANTLPTYYIDRHVA